MERDYPNGPYMPWVDRPVIKGFLHPHQPNRVADDKRKRVQYEWAYQSRNVEEDGFGGWQVPAGQRIPYLWGEFTKTPTAIRADLAPRIWDNVPNSGFKILDLVSRYRGNKLYQVEDPRGGIFEISSKSLFGILEDGTISKGRILDKCIWKSNKMLVVAEPFLGIPE